MATNDRRQRHRAQIRTVILATARELLLSEGVRNVSLRQIAERIEYCPAALYTYFGSKDDIFLALAREDAAVLDRQLYEATRDVIDPLARVRRALRTMLEFLNANPLFLELMVLNSSGGRIQARREQVDCFREVAAVVEADVYECIERGELSMALTAAATCQLLWAGMLGAASVVRWRAGCEESDVVAGNLLETLLAGLSTGRSQPRESSLASTFREASA